MKSILNLKLNKDYRDPVILDTETSVFRGRKNELNKLVDLVKFRKSASVLIGGVRGVGKTSFTREALRMVGTSKEQEIYTVDLTFANLETEGTENDKKNDLRNTILKALIRGLYLCNPDCQNEIVDLYDKTYFSELSNTGLMELIFENNTLKEEKKSIEKIWRLDIGSPLEMLFKVIGTGGITYILANLIERVTISLSWWQLLSVTFLILLFGLLIVLLALKKVETRKRTGISEINEENATRKINSSGIAKYDLSSDTLEIGLRQALTKLSKSGHKVVFIIDELDKLESETDKIYDIIKTFKNLFSLSNAIFIFIASSKFFDEIENKKADDPYSVYHTIFTDKIFLPALYYQDVNDIIDSFLDKNESTTNINYIKFKAFIGWQAKNHIFDTHNLIEEFTQHAGNGEAFVVVNEDDVLERGNIAGDWEIAASLQQYIAATYDEKSYPNNPRKNELLYLTLREIGESLYSDYEITIKGNDFMSKILPEKQKAIGLDALSAETKRDFSGAIEDLLLRTDRYGLTVSNEEQIPIEGSDPPKTIRKVVFEVNPEVSFPDLKEIKKSTAVSSFENDFLTSMKSLENIIMNIEKVGLMTLTQPYQQQIKFYQTIRKPIKQESPRKRLKSHILNDINGLNQIQRDIVIQAPKEYIKGIASDNGFSICPVSDDGTGQPIWNLDPNLSSFLQYVNSTLVFDQTYTFLSGNGKYVLIGFDLDQNVQNEYLKNRMRKFAKTKVINILHENSNEPNKWRIFQLKTDLSNLSSLSESIKMSLK